MTPAAFQEYNRHGFPFPYKFNDHFQLIVQNSLHMSRILPQYSLLADTLLRTEVHCLSICFSGKESFNLSSVPS